MRINWINIVQNRCYWRPFVNAVINLQVLKKFGEFSD
jgi:hypothetical protein